jgi:integrase
VTRRLCTIAGFYRNAVEEELLGHSPAAHVHRPRLDYESHATGLDRNELGALLVAAGLGPSAERALISLLALNGLRVSEATGADIEALGMERGHRTLVITRKGGKRSPASGLPTQQCRAFHMRNEPPGPHPGLRHGQWSAQALAGVGIAAVRRAIPVLGWPVDASPNGWFCTRRRPALPAHQQRDRAPVRKLPSRSGVPIWSCWRPPACATGA